jgi:GAF domain-containing protein
MKTANSDQPARQPVKAVPGTSSALNAEPVDVYGSDEIARVLERFGALLRTSMPLAALLQSVCHQIVATIPVADMAGVTVLSAAAAAGASPETVACTDERALDVDIDQYRANEGPCLEAARTQQVVRVRIDDAARRWPAFADNVAGMGVASYLSAPLAADERHVGALNLYSFSDHGFSNLDEVLLQVFVAAVEGAVWNARRAEQWQAESVGLQEAMKSRAVIEQAKGMLMILREIDEDAAFKVLVEQSQHRNVRLAVVATELVDSITHR